MHTRTKWTFFCLASLTACGSDDPVGDETGTLADTAGPTTATGLEIAGDYTDSYGSTWSITESQIVLGYPGYDPSQFSILQYDNATDVILAQNDASNPYSGGLYSRFDWYDDGTSLWICQTAYAAATLDEAEATPAADPTDPATDGCGGFPWTGLTP
jgi:hypothetical protein